MEDICADIAGYFTPFALCLSAFVLVKGNIFPLEETGYWTRVDGGRNLWESFVLKEQLRVQLALASPLHF